MLEDWTDGNKSRAFIDRVGFITRVIRNNAWDLINGQPETVARLILAQLAHATDPDIRMIPVDIGTDRKDTDSSTKKGIPPMPPNRIDLSSFLDDADKTNRNAVQLISDAKRAAADAQTKCDRVTAPATTAGSESASAKAIFQEVDGQQDKLIAANLDPAAVFQGLLNHASRLAQSAKDRLITAHEASAG